MKTLTSADFEKMFGGKLSAYVKKKIRQYAFAYRDATQTERDLCIKKAVQALADPYLVYSGKHRLAHWEKGWGENLKAVAQTGESAAIMPRYFGKYEFLRINQKFVRSLSKDFERNSLYIIQDWLFDTYLRTAAAIYEFGCGTGHNLFRAREVNQNASLYGLDWATSSQKILAKLKRENIDKNISGKRFDFFKPDNSFKLEPHSAVYTVAALEQTGENFKPFVEYLIRNKPDICIHIEPVAELLNPDNLLDYLSIEYFKKRKYLWGFLAHLRALEKAGRVKIIKAKRNFIGSLFIEGYSAVIWKAL